MAPWGALAAAAGVVLWTFLEYCIHRWLGHKHRNNPFAAEHIRHHSQGNYFAPPWKKAGAAVVVAALLFFPSWAVVGPIVGGAFTVGFVACYLTYEVVHRRQHTHAGLGPYGRWLRRHHFFHHFADPSKNHGVTTPIWDWVFGTLAQPSVIVVPEKLKMQWLTDDAGEVHEAFAPHYQIKRKKRRRSRPAHAG